MATYYFDTNGVDSPSRNGGVGQEWASLYWACTHVFNYGDIIHGNSGDYDESSNICELAVNVSLEGETDMSTHILFNYKSVGTADGQLRLIGGSNNSQHISYIHFDGNNLNGWMGLSVYDRSNVVIHHCRVRNFQFKGIILAGSDISLNNHNEIHHCTVDNCAGGLAYGHGDEGMNIEWVNQTESLIYSNTIGQADRGDNYNGIGIGGYEDSPNPMLIRCKIYDNDIIWVSRKWTYWSFAIELWLPQELEIYDNVIEGEVDLCKHYYNANYDYTVYFHDNIVGWSSIQPYITLGIQFEAMNVGIIVCNNIFFNVDYGIYFCNYHDFDNVGEYVKDIWVYSNVLYGIGVSEDAPWGSAIYFEAGNPDELYANPPVYHEPPLYYDNIHILNNTIVAHPDYPARYGIDLPCSTRSSSTMNFNVRNNIVVGFAMYGIGSRSIDPEVTPEIDSIDIFDNLLYDNGNNNNSYFSGVAMSNYNYNDHIKSDPLFIDFLSNLRLVSSDSPAYHAGSIVNFPYDLGDNDNIPFNEPPTIGAYEIDEATPSLSLYVSTTGNDLNSGTINFPFATVKHAYSLAVDGTTIFMRGGTYTEFYGSGTEICYLLNKDASAGNPITLRAYNDEVVILDGGEIDDGDHVTVVQISGDYNQIIGLEIKRGIQSGVHLYSNYSLIRDCYIHNNGNLGDMTYRGGQCGIIIGSIEHDNIIEDNIIIYNGRYTQEDNSIDHGIYEMGDNNTIRRNIINYNASFGVQLAGGATISGSKIYNNVFAFNFISGIIVWEEMDGVEIRNNIFYKNAEYGISSYEASGEGVLIDHNLFYMNGVGDYNLSPEGLYTLSNNLTSNPLFVSESDFHLQSSSPAINAGIDVGLSYFGSAPDIGAFEYDDTPFVFSGVTNGVATVFGSFRSAEWIPNSHDFTLKDVCNIVRPAYDTLISCFQYAIPCMFDPIYEGNHDRLSNFRNYGPRCHNELYGSIYGVATVTGILQSTIVTIGISGLTNGVATVTGILTGILDMFVVYGYLYNWYAVSDARGLAPVGWHVSSAADLQSLVNDYGPSPSRLKEVGTTRWSVADGTDEVGFTAVGAGYRDVDGLFKYVKDINKLWRGNFSFVLNIPVLSNMTTSSTDSRVGASVRIVKDDSTDPGTVTGNDGKVYPTVKIGDRVWLACNLCETKYRNLDDIPEVIPDEEWIALSTGAWCIYGLPYTLTGHISGTSNITFTASGELTDIGYLNVVYGYMYNWFAVSDARNIANTGWHVPTNLNWAELGEYLGSLDYAGGHLKEIGYTYWNSPNTGADNSSKFSAKGSGNRGHITADFAGIKEMAAWWAIEEAWNDADSGSLVWVAANMATFVCPEGEYSVSSNKKIAGNGVRLIKDSTLLSHGQTGIYIGNDGKVYRTICIGTQEWLSENLCETKYRNLDDIPEVIPNNEWLELLTGAWSIYGTPYGLTASITGITNGVASVTGNIKIIGNLMGISNGGSGQTITIATGSVSSAYSFYNDQSIVYGFSFMSQDGFRLSKFGGYICKVGSPDFIIDFTLAEANSDGIPTSDIALLFSINASELSSQSPSSYYWWYPNSNYTLEENTFYVIYMSYRSIVSHDINNNVMFLYSSQDNNMYCSIVSSVVGGSWTLFSTGELRDMSILLGGVWGTLQEGEVPELLEPSDLVIDTISNVEQDLSWTNNDTYASIRIERSSDGVNFIEVDSISGSAESYEGTGLTGSRQYWWRIRGYYMGYYSDYSNVVNDWTAWKIVMTSQGTGADYTFFNYIVLSSSNTAYTTIDGNGKFYTDRYGAGETSDITLGVGKENFYVKVTSGVANILIFDKGFITYWGGCALSGGGTISVQQYNGNSPKVNVEVNEMPRSLIQWYCSVSYGAVNGSISELPPSIDRVNLAYIGTGSMTGYISDIPSSCTFFGAIMTVVNGDLSDIPSGMVGFLLYSNGGITGDISDLPKGNLQYFHISGSNSISGDVADLSGIPLILFNVGGSNTIEGDVSSFPSTLQTISIRGNTTVSGDVAGLPSGLISIIGYIALSGDVADLPSSLTTLQTDKATSLSGDIADLPSGLLYLKLMDASDTNTLTGDVADLPTVLYSLEVYGNNTIGGDIADIPDSVVIVDLRGSNTLSGALSGAGANLAYLTVLGLNTLSGDLAGLPVGLSKLYLVGNNTVDTYTSGHAWSNSMYLTFTFAPVSPGGLSSSEMDNLIIDLNTYITTTRYPVIYATLTGTNAARTSASDAAVTALAAKNFYVTTNP